MNDQVARARKARPAESEGSMDRPQIGGLTITVIHKIHEPIYGGGSASIGEAIDDHLNRCANEGMDVLDITFAMEPQQWNDLRKNYLSADRVRS